jgi:hypothetical protein
MTKSILLGLGLVVCACATLKKSAAESAAEDAMASQVAAKRGDDHPLYVARTADGELVMAASHHDAMNGLAVGSTEMGVKGREDALMICKRVMLTGSHMPEWTCRYMSEVEQDRMRTQMMLLKIPRACMSLECWGDQF